MTSLKPYLLRAFYEWMVDNEETPQLVVKTRTPGLNIPKHLHQNEQIVLNAAPSAIRNLNIGNDAVEFDATFKGVPGTVYIPFAAIVAIYAKEDGRGTVFGDDEEDIPPPIAPVPSSNEKVEKRPSKKGKPKLKVVK